MPFVARLFRLHLVVIAISVLVACAGGGKKWDTTHANDVQIGQDKAQIQAWFGDPWQRAPLPQQPGGCTEQWTYSHAWSNYGGTQTTVHTLVVLFDDQEKVCSHAYQKQ